MRTRYLDLLERAFPDIQEEPIPRPVSTTQEDDDRDTESTGDAISTSTVPYAINAVYAVTIQDAINAVYAVTIQDAINAVYAVMPGLRCNWPGCREPVRLVQLHGGTEEQQCGYSHAQAWEPVTFTQDTAARYPCTISWAKTYGYLAIRDPFTGALHEVRTEDAPASWRDAARLARRARPVAEVGAR